MAQNDTPDFDDSMLKDIEASLPKAEFRSFIEEYLASAADRLRRVSEVHGTGNLAELATEAHALISTSGSFGVRRAGELARELETACKGRKVADAARLMAELEASSQRGWAALRARFLAG